MLHKIKIIATIGPQSNSQKILEQYAQAGMNMIRLNTSHADFAWHQNMIRLIRQWLPDQEIWLDLPGPKIRLQDIKHDIAFKKGEVVAIPFETEFLKKYEQWLVQPEKSIIIDDGKYKFLTTPDLGRCKALNSGILRSRQGVNIPHFPFTPEDLITNRDKEMIKLASEVDYLGVSYASSATHIKEIRTLLTTSDNATAFSPLTTSKLRNNAFHGPHLTITDQSLEKGRLADLLDNPSDAPANTPTNPHASLPDVKILAKIETQSGLEHLEEIVKESDGIVVARGDLGIETPLEQVILNQKKILRKSANKLTIVATEMLTSMIDHPYPTRAEISDITNAILDGARGLALTQETAIGAFGAQAINMLQKVIKVVIEEQGQGQGQE